MPLCPACQQPASKRNGLDRAGRQKYACRTYRRTFTENTVSAFSGYRWPRDVIVMAVRWYLAYPLSSRQVLELLAERGIDVSHRTVLNWVQTFGPQLAAEVRRHRRRVGRCWFVDEVFLFRKSEKRYLYRAIDENGVVVERHLSGWRRLATARGDRQANWIRRVHGSNQARRSARKPSSMISANAAESASSTWWSIRLRPLSPPVA
jgi:transposase-like protein